MPTAAQDLIDRLRHRVDQLDRWRSATVPVELERNRRQIAEWRRADAIEAEEQRDRARRDSARCDRHQRVYDEAFGAHGKTAPPPLADEHPPTYRRRLFSIGQSMLPSDHELVGFDPEDLDGHVIAPFEGKLFDALKEQAEQPSGDNLPESPDDPRARREVFDDSLQRKITVYKAKNSFIKYMPSHAQRVLRLMNPKTGQIYFGPPFDKVPGR
jgi:hypothetical protein